MVSAVELVPKNRAERAAGILFQGNVYRGADAEENRAVVARLAAIGEPFVQLAPRDSSQSEWMLDKSVRAALERMVGQRVELARSVLYQAGNPGEWNLDYYGRCRVGRTGFGAKDLPDGWARRCNAMDEVWVPSAFDRDSFLESGVEEERLHIVPTGVDTQIFRPGLRPLEIPCRRGFQFLSLTDLEPRRGTDVLLRAYLEEFQSGEDVALVLAISEGRHGIRNAEAEIAYFIETQVGMRLEDTAQVILVETPSSESERARLYASADAFVAPVRASVWGRTVMESQAAGLPVIATGWGGHLEFLNDDNAFLVSAKELVAVSSEEELYAGSRWVEPSAKELREDLRRVVSDRQETRRRALRGREDTVANRDWDVVIEEWAEAISLVTELAEIVGPEQRRKDMIATRLDTGRTSDTGREAAARTSVTVEELDRAVGENALLQVEVSRQMALRIVEMREELRAAKDEIASLRRQLEQLTLGVQQTFEVTRQERLGMSGGNGKTSRVATRLVNVGKLLKMGSDVRVNLGCGPKPQPDYLNVDERELEGVDLVADVRSLPFQEEAVSEIYAAHVVEHFTEAELRTEVLPAWCRLLKPEGKLRIAVPDAVGMIQAYGRGDYTFENLRTVTYGGQDYAGNFHYTMFSRESLQSILQGAGFSRGEYTALARVNGLCLEMEIEAKKA